MAQKFGGLKNPPAIETMMDADLVASLYQDGKLIWPEK
jgi:NitT/TauT family transport system substrate-binding protein